MFKASKIRSFPPGLTPRDVSLANAAVVKQSARRVDRERENKGGKQTDGGKQELRRDSDRQEGKGFDRRCFPPAFTSSPRDGGGEEGVEF